MGFADQQELKKHFLPVSVTVVKHVSVETVLLADGCK